MELDMCHGTFGVATANQSPPSLSASAVGGLAVQRHFVEYLQLSFVHVCPWLEKVVSRISALSTGKGACQWSVET